jgi:hypothetical protein
MSFNLNISNYSISEIEELLNLSIPYTPINIKQNANRLINNIKHNNIVDDPLKQKTIQFLQSCVDILINHTSPSTTTPSSLSSSNINTNNTNNDNPHQIITKPQTPYIMSYPQEYFSGQINPLHKRIIKKILNVDTRFRDNYTTNVATNCSILLPIEFKNIVNMQLMSIEIPNTFYTISEQYHNNYFSIRCGLEKITYIIPDGIYTNQDLVDFLNNYAVNNNIDPLVYQILYYMSFSVNINNNITIPGESGSGQFIIGISPDYIGIQPPDFSVNFLDNIDGTPDFNTPINLKLGWLLGFRSGVYSGNSVYISEGIIDLYGPKYGFLAVDDYNNNVNNGFYSAFTQSILNQNILSRISFPNQTSKTFNIINHNNMNLITYPRQYFGPVDIHKLSIQLLDEYGRILNLNNMDFSFCLAFDMIYDL